MAKSRTEPKRTSERREKTAHVPSDQPPFPVHLPDPPTKSPWFLGLAVTLLTAWLLALLAMALLT